MIGFSMHINNETDNELKAGRVPHKIGIAYIEYKLRVFTKSMALTKISGAKSFKSLTSY